VVRPELVPESLKYGAYGRFGAPNPPVHKIASKQRASAGAILGKKRYRATT
jgi:hypothetical protein